MAQQNERNQHKQQIYNHMQLKETDELLEIWIENNRDEWTEEAFGIIQEILQERLGEVPEQVSSRQEESEVIEPAKSSNKDFQNLSKWLPVAIWLKRASWAVLVFTGVSIVVKLTYDIYRLLPTNNVFEILLSFAGIIDSLILLGFIFFVLTALSEILYLLGGMQVIAASLNSDEKSL